MELLKLIHTSGVSRNFNDADISDESINMILEAGVWSLSVLGMQPFDLYCVKNRQIIDKIAETLTIKSNDNARGFDMIMRLTANAIKTCKVLIAVYNNAKLQKRAKAFGEFYVKCAYNGEMQTIGACVQNMFLAAKSLGLGAIWLDAATFCEKETNEIFNTTDQYVAFLAIGHSNRMTERSKRKVKLTYL